MGQLTHADIGGELTQAEWEAVSTHKIGGVASLNIIRSATLVVAASNASAAYKAQADYVCDGTADNVEIQAAIDALTNGTGKIILSEGTFSLAASIVINNTWGCIIEGMGRGTVIQPQAGATFYAFTVGSSGKFCFGLQMKDFKLDGSVGQWPGGIDLQCGDRQVYQGIYADYCGTVMRLRNISGTEVNAITIRDCHFIRFSAYGIYGVQTVTECLIEGCTISAQDYANTGIGIYLTGDPFAIVLLNDVFEANLTSVKMLGGYPKSIIGCAFSDDCNNEQLWLNGGEVVDNCWFGAVASVGMRVVNGARIDVRGCNWSAGVTIFTFTGTTHAQSYFLLSDYVTKNKGVESNVTLDANGVGAIAHGCIITPDYANVICQSANLNVRISSIDATNINIVVYDLDNAPVTVDTHDFYWEARYRN